MISDKIYFKYHLAHDNYIQSVQFIVTIISGEITMYSSRKIKYPNATHFDKKSNVFDN